MFNWIKCLFTKNEKNSSANERNLIYPYISQNELSKNSQINLANLTRIDFARKYCNQKLYKPHSHKALKKYLDQQVPLHWIALVSDVKRPNSSNENPILLLEKVAVIKDGYVTYLDNHLWLNLVKIKYTLNDNQVIAIGDAICGISQINTYLGKNNETKYGLNRTIITGAGIFSGKTGDLDYRTIISQNFITNYDRANDWILKLSNSYKLAISNNIKNIDFEKLFNLPKGVNFRYKDSNYRDYHLRKIIRQNQDKREKEKKQPKFVLKKIKHNLIRKNPLLQNEKRYQATFFKYSFYNDDEGNFIPIIILTDVKDELGKSIVKKTHIRYSPEIAEIGKINLTEHINFSSKQNPKNGTNSDILATSFKPILQKKRSLMPVKDEQMVGALMYKSNNSNPENAVFIEHYRAWAKKNNIKLNKIKNRKKDKLKSFAQIAEQFGLSSTSLHSYIFELKISSAYIENNIEYYSNDSIEKIAQKVKLERMLNRLKANKQLVSKDYLDHEFLKRDSNIKHTILVTNKNSYTYSPFDTLTKDEIKIELTKLKNARTVVYLKVKSIKSKELKFISVNELISFCQSDSDEICYL